MLGEYLDKFVMVYLNNIIIYSISKEEYEKKYLIGLKETIKRTDTSSN